MIDLDDIIELEELPSDSCLKHHIQDAFPAMTDDHFANHYSTLYIYPTPGVAKWVAVWLRAHGGGILKMAWFYSQAGSGWAGAGHRCIEVPFAHW